MADVSRLVRPRSVTGDGEGLVSHAGLVWLGEVADRSGLTDGLCEVARQFPRRRHDPGRTLAHMILALADGATCVSDLAVLRDQPALFGPVASHATAWRTFRQMGPVEFRRLAAARANARAAAWAAGAGPAGDELIIDFDATLIRTRSEKQEAGPTYKGTYGFHPLLAMIAETGEVLTGKLRPGNAGANNAEDHVIVLNAAIGQLPPIWQTGHRPGNSPESVEKQLVARSDAAGASHWFVEECRHRNIGYTIGYQVDHRVRDAVYWSKESSWDPAIEPGGRLRLGAEIIELTDQIDMSSWPDGTRLIVRREDPHPGAQLSLFDTIEGKRHTAFITDSPGDPTALELRHRQRGRAEGVIRDAKACGMTKLPFEDVVNNNAWLHLCFAANDLLAWGRAISLTGTLRKATPKTIRYRILHVAARTSPGHQHLRLDQTWPWTTQITHAITTLQQRLQPPAVTTTRGIHPGL